MQWWTAVESPIGRIVATGGAEGVTAMGWNVEAAGDEGDPLGVGDALRRWVGGALDALDAVAVAAAGTAFQQAVWAALRRIPVGETTTYGALAVSLGRPSAVRAVARANATNPVGIVVPCHRVIGSDGRLVGYAGGLWRKRWLLAHEGAKGFLVP
ncbi:MAG: methylated-DNA--[protein]-cysteine S-methyltransferase [Myxococcales bacterium]|nr:methylated-DNA--[protein]-cysteine S-methyltransferase [Myxococcales bacterium]